MLKSNLDNNLTTESKEIVMKNDDLESWVLIGSTSKDLKAQASRCQELVIVELLGVLFFKGRPQYILR